MPWKGVVPSTLQGNGMTPVQLRQWLDAIKTPWPWKPSGGTLHNTAAPTLAQYQARRKSHGRADRFVNLERYYRDQQHWSAGPHFFVDELSDGIYPFTPIYLSGVHSPGFNGSKFGVEMFGDYAHEDDDRGDGYKVKMNAVAVFGEIYAHLGLDPDGITLHKDDKLTTHDCPGKDVEKGEFISLVKQYMGDAGDHNDKKEIPLEPEPIIKPQAVEKLVSPIVGKEGLNLRDGSATRYDVIAVLQPHQKVAVFKTALNGKTEWSYVWLRLPSGKEHTGWVASRYLA